MSINLSAMTNMGPLNLMLVDIYGKLYILQNIGYVAVRGKSIDAMRQSKTNISKAAKHQFPQKQKCRSYLKHKSCYSFFVSYFREIASMSYNTY